MMKKPKVKVNTKKLVCTVISLIDRAESRQATIEQLEQVGLKPQVIESDPRQHMRDYGNHFSNAQASAEAIDYALLNKSDLLFCEDDIEIGRHFAAFLNKARLEHPEDITYFYAHDIPKKMSLLYENDIRVLIKAKQFDQPQIIPIRTNQWLPFTQCVLIPHKHLLAFDLDFIKKGTKSFDLYLMHDYIKKHRLQPLMALPHPVQHLISREGRNQENPERHSYKKSLSYTG